MMILWWIGSLYARLYNPYGNHFHVCPCVCMCAFRVTTESILWLTSLCAQQYYLFSHPQICCVHVGRSFVEHPKDFNSYVLINDSSNFMRRPVIAFQCTYDTDSTIRPHITWQKCHSTGDCFDILETTDMVAEGHIQKYVFFQSGYTGYFQIQDRNNESLNGTSYRCKASSPLPEDTAEVFSEPAKVIFHAAGKR